MNRLVLVLALVLIGGCYPKTAPAKRFADAHADMRPAPLESSPIQIVTPPTRPQASPSAQQGLGPYRYTHTTFELGQDCQGLIRKRWKCRSCEFEQLDRLDSESTTRKGSFTWWRSWVKHHGVRQSFTCVHNAETNWMTIIFGDQCNPGGFSNDDVP